MKSFGLILLILSTAAAVMAQGPVTNANGLLPNVISASPEAASLGKYGEWPVSEYTGVPDISIPIYSIQLKGLDIPIQLSYHASGIKVDEMASWVGTGWTLNAGGAVTRTIVGLADDDVGGILQQYQQGNYLKGSYSLTDTGDYVFFRKVADQLIDVEPDIYYYNFVGNSGKFCFDTTGAFHAIPANTLQVIQSPFWGLAGTTVSNTQWVIADDKGNNYYFGSVDSVSGGTNGVEETASGISPLPVESLKTTAWYLTKVITADKVDTVYFDYGPKNELYFLPAAISINALANGTSLPAFPTTPGSWVSYLNANSPLYNGNEIQGSVLNEAETTGASTLQRIRWRGGEVDFVSKTQRLDMPNPIAFSDMLDSVNVYNQSGTKIKTFGLSYSYVQNRYFLDSLREIPQDQSQPLTNKFSYINRSQLPVSASLTGIGSYDQDHWGYYNGAGNTSFLPSDPILLAIQGANVSTYLTANREPDTVKMQDGTLNKIVYPTGGSTVFSYESNRYDPSNVPAGSNPPTIVVYTGNMVQGNTASPYNQFATFTPGITQTASITVQVFNYGDPPSKNMSWLPYLTLGYQNLSGFEQTYYGDAFDNFPAGGVTANSNGLYNYTYTISNVTLNAGETYSLIASDTCLKTINCAVPQSPMPYIIATINYYTYATAPVGGGTAPLPIAGGLRVKQMANYDVSGRFIGGKSFSYAPGNLLIYPQYDRHVQQDVTWELNTTTCEGCARTTCSPNEADIWEEFSTSQVLLGVTQGSPVGYTQVAEKDVDSLGNDQGYTNYVFSFSPDSLNTLSFDISYTAWSNMAILNPTVPMNSFDYKCGLLLSKNIFKRNLDGSYTEIQSVINAYNFNDFNTENHYTRIRGLRLLRLRSIASSGGQYTCGPAYGAYVIPEPLEAGITGFSPDFGYAFYNIISSWVQNTTSTQTQYDQNGQNPVTKVTSTYYDNPIHMQPTRTVTNRSNQDSLVSLVNYPQDYAQGTPFIDSLVAHNVTSLPIENAMYQIDPLNNITVLGGKTTTYLPDGKGLPSSIQLLETTAPIALNQFQFSNTAGLGALPFNTPTKGTFSADSRYVTRANFISYDNYKNILQEAKSSDFNHSYLWDYKGRYPIAQVENAAQSDIAYTSFEADGTGNWNVPATGVVTGQSMTGNNAFALGGNSITKSGLNTGTTYVVSYWSMGGALNVNGTAATAGATVGPWTYYEHKVTGASTVTVSGNATIDELRLFPNGALMTTYTYTPLVGMTSQCTPTNYITYYNYDGLERLANVKDLRGNVIKTYQYHYIQQN